MASNRQIMTAEASVKRPRKAHTPPAVSSHCAHEFKGAILSGKGTGAKTEPPMGKMMAVEDAASCGDSALSGC
jgi:hypothetical protein